MVRRVIGFVRRILPSLGIVAVGVLLSAMIFSTLRSFEHTSAEASFNGAAQERLDAVETNVTLTVNNLVFLGAFFDASHDVERQEFTRFTLPLLPRNRAIQALDGFHAYRIDRGKNMRRMRVTMAFRRPIPGSPLAPADSQSGATMSTSPFFSSLPSKATRKPWVSTLHPTPSVGQHFEFSGFRSVGR